MKSHRREDGISVCVCVCVQGQAAEQKEQTQKYSVKPPRDLLSGFERSQADRRQADAQAAVLKKQLEADRLQEVKQVALDNMQLKPRAQSPQCKLYA